MDKNKRFLIIGVIAVLSLVIIFIFISKDEAPNITIEAPSIPTPWQPTHHAFDPNRCKDGKCKEMLRLPMMGTSKLSFMVDPEVDDPVAQWSDCLASITQCIDHNDTFTVKGFHECVRQSTCPESCKDGFNHKTQHTSDIKGMMAAFDTYFIGEGGTCVPK